MYVFTFISLLILKEPSRRLPNLLNRIFFTTYHLSWPLLLPCSRMSSNITLTIPSRMSRIQWHGGSRTSPVIPTLSDGIGLLINIRYAVQLQSLILDFMVYTATSVDVEWVFSKGRLILSVKYVL